ncbi:hypothetical protein [Tenacibaculum halocynthiae]|uniref:hypothetical protein n=1 Tax=Tenacibaculum halocynthiae TaxID=1254437 RepID=UPI003D655D4B
MNFLFMNILYEGGLEFMYPMMILLIVCVILLIKSFMDGDKNGKKQKIIGHLSLFTLVWGFLGFMINMIWAFDSISIASGINHSVLAVGLKEALLSPTFGMLVFLIVRVGLIALNLKKQH